MNRFQIYDDEIFNSVIASKRHFCELTIDLKSCRLLSSLKRIEAIVSKYGLLIKKFKIWNSIQNESSELSEVELLTLLKLIPIVEDLTLRNICIRASFTEPEELDLRCCRRLVTDYCIFESAIILDSIPKDVLAELVFTFDSSDEKRFQNFFNRQSKIKKLEIFENDSINFDHLQLEHLKISSSHNFVSILNNQPGLRYLDFAVSWIDESVFAAVCELKHLEVFRTLIDQVSSEKFKALRKLSTLKELRLDSHSSYDTGQLLELSMIKSLYQLKKLTLLHSERKIPEEILIQMSESFRCLRHIEVVNRSIKIIKLVLEQFPLLESILFDFFAIFGAPEDILEISDDFFHENLKQLVITNVNVNEISNTEALLKLVNACRNLERIMLSELEGVSNENLKQIFNVHLSLSHLSLEFKEFELSSESIELVKSSATKLKHFRLNGISNFPSYPILKSLFEEDFPSITLFKYSTGVGELIMKKRRVHDWYMNFKLMDHF